MDVVPLDAEDLRKHIDEFALDEFDCELIVHFTPERTRVEVEAMAKVLAEAEKAVHADMCGQKFHLILGSTQVGSGAHPTLFKGMGESPPCGDGYFQTRGAAEEFVMCLWRKLGYATP